jgi:hypothetical protein
VPARTVETVDSGDHPTSGSGTAGSTSGTAGAAGSGTGGSTGVGGSTSDASVDAPATGDGSTGPTCFAEDDANAGDAGAEGCDSLAYFDKTCTDDGGTAKPAGVQLCQGYEHAGLKAAAFEQLRTCLKNVPSADVCAQAHVDAVNACGLAIFQGATCTVPAVNVDGGATGCAQIVAACPGSDAGADGGTPGVTMANCNRWLQPWTPEARRAAVECFLDPASQADSCAETFELCIPFPPFDF